MEGLLDRLVSKYSKMDENTYRLLGQDNQTCGLISTEFNHDVEYLCARLVFNEDKELIGMGFSDLGVVEDQFTNQPMV